MVDKRWVLLIVILIYSQSSALCQWSLGLGVFADLWITNANSQVENGSFDYRQRQLLGYYSWGLKPSYSNHALLPEDYIVPSILFRLERIVSDGEKCIFSAGFRLSPHNRNHIYSAIELTGVNYVDDLGKPIANGYHPTYGSLIYGYHSKYGIYGRVALKSKRWLLNNVSINLGIDYLSSATNWLMFDALYNEWQNGFGEHEMFPSPNLSSNVSSIKSIHYSKYYKHGAGIAIGCAYAFSWFRKKINSEINVTYNLGLFPLVKSRYYIDIDGEVFEYNNVNKGTSLQIGVFTDLWRFGKRAEEGL